jgi:HK97 family phage major capsid protein
MATELTAANGWLPEPKDSQVLQAVLENSAVEAVARKVAMTTRTVSVPRHDAEGVQVVAEHANIPLQDATLDEVELTAVKFAARHAVSLEGTRDGIADEINLYKTRWASNFAVALDNACLGAASGPFTSVVAAGAQKITLTGALTYEQLSDVVGDLEVGQYGDDLVVIAHPAFKAALRNMKDDAGMRVLSDPLAAGTPSIFGYEVRYSKGAVASTSFSDRPTGAPLLIVGSKRNLILGTRDGVESALSDQARWETDEVELKVRARRGFKVADETAFTVIQSA